MIKRLLRLAPILLLAACGADDPTGDNEFVALTAITIESQYPKIDAGTSNQFKATGDFSGEFTRDITNEVIWATDTPGTLNFIDLGTPGLGKGISQGTANITATMNGVNGLLNFSVTSVGIQTVTVAPPTADVAIGLTENFTATGNFNDGTTQDITRDVTWGPATGTIATVDQRGVATAKALGNVTVTATFGSASGQATLNVIEAAVLSISVTPSNQTFAKGETVNFKATANLSNGTTKDVTSTATWDSADNTKVTIDSTGKATAVEVGGPVSITAEFNGTKGSTNMTVSTVTSIAITPENPEVTVGGTEQLTATATFSNTATRDITAIATWTSDQTGVGRATVDKGLVTGITAGTVRITATKDVSQSIDVTVTQ